MYKIKCEICGKTKNTRYKKQRFCSKKCAGINNIKSRVYACKSHRQTETHYMENDTNALFRNAVLFLAIDRYLKNGIRQINPKKSVRKCLKHPATQKELFDYIRSGEIVSRPAIIKIIKQMVAYKEYLLSSKKLDNL